MAKVSTSARPPAGHALLAAAMVRNRDGFQMAAGLGQSSPLAATTGAARNRKEKPKRWGSRKTLLSSISQQQKAALSQQDVNLGQCGNACG
jgi:hypothetical protein